MGEISELCWLIILVKHAIWPNSMHFMHLLLTSISEILASLKLTL
jgi:hypothetical protein